MYRYLQITSPDRLNDNYINIHKYYRKNIQEAHKRLLKIKNIISPNSKQKFKLELIGLDGSIKKTFKNITQNTLPTIFKLIDKMPFGHLRPSHKTLKNVSLLKKGKTTVKGLSLYSDYKPNTTLKGTGFKNAKTAKQTLKLIKDRDLTYQKRVIQTMYNRAKYHPHQTKQMQEAMQIFKSWLNTHH